MNVSSGASSASFGDGSDADTLVLRQQATVFLVSALLVCNLHKAGAHSAQTRLALVALSHEQE